MEATDTAANTKVHAVTERSGPRIEASVTALTKFSKPTKTCQPGSSSSPSAETNAPSPLSV